MAILHLVSQSPYDSCGLTHCLSRAGAGDAILLLENGVYAARKAFSPLYVSTGQKLFVLREDLDSRGVGCDELIPEITLVDYPGFVDLVTEYTHSLSW